MNELIRNLINERIDTALSEAKHMKELEHPALNGKVKEILLDKLINPLLSAKYSSGTGKIIDFKGSKSKEIDICIYSTHLHPPIFFSEPSKFGIFPIESVLSCIEVKSNLTKNNLRDAYEKFKYLEENLTITSGFHDEYEMPLSHIIIKHKYSLFFFSSNLKTYKPETILNLYKEFDPNWNSSPLISSICLAEKGWLCFTIKGWLHMEHDIQNNKHEEIVGYLSTLIQDLPRAEASRGTPRIGYYLTDQKNTGRFKNGKLVKRPWIGISVDFTTTDVSNNSEI